MAALYFLLSGTTIVSSSSTYILHNGVWVLYNVTQEKGPSRDSLCFSARAQASIGVGLEHRLSIEVIGPIDLDHQT